jgi:hypothetical protein
LPNRDAPGAGARSVITHHQSRNDRHLPPPTGFLCGSRIPEETMLRKLSCLIALGTLAASAAASPAGAGYYYRYGCASCAPYYVVNHGPVYSGPGIVVAPGYFDLDPGLPVAYPYVGPHYWYRPYDGGPYADPIRHGIYYRHHGRYYAPAELGPGPQIIHVGGRIRPHHHARVPQRLPVPPLDPRDN